MVKLNGADQLCVSRMEEKTQVDSQRIGENDGADGVMRVAQNIKAAENDGQNGVLERLMKASMRDVVDGTESLLKSKMAEKESKSDDNLLSKYTRQTYNSVLGSVLKEKATDIGNMESLVIDLKNTVQNVLTAAREAKTLSLVTQTDIVSKLNADFKTQLMQRFNKMQINNKDLQVKAFNLYETKLDDKKSISIDFQKSMQLQSFPSLTALKLSSEGRRLVQSLQHAGDIEDVLSVTLKESQKDDKHTDETAYSLGYAAGGSIYIPGNDGAMYVTTSQALSKKTAVDVFVQGNKDSNALMTTLKFSPKDHLFKNTSMLVGRTDNATAVSATAEYVPSDGDKSVKADTGVVDGVLTGKISYEQQLSETEKVSIDTVYVDTFTVNAEFLSKQADTLYKVGLYVAEAQKAINYTYQNEKGAFAQVGINYQADEEENQKLGITLKAGYSRTW